MNEEIAFQGAAVEEYSKNRLERMERALGIELRPEQREIVLDNESPYFKLKDWSRASGKSLCAILWYMLHKVEPVSITRINRVPDPDANRSINAKKSLSYQYFGIQSKLESEGIFVPPFISEKQHPIY